eukprot:465874-Pelagomonas_calceolata.AAC.3
MAVSKVNAHDYVSNHDVYKKARSPSGSSLAPELPVLKRSGLPWLVLPAREQADCPSHDGCASGCSIRGCKDAGCSAQALVPGREDCDGQHTRVSQALACKALRSSGAKPCIKRSCSSSDPSFFTPPYLQQLWHHSYACVQQIPSGVGRVDCSRLCQGCP